MTKNHLSEKVKAVIGMIASEHCHKTFGYLDKEDLQGEIWVICIQALPEYDPDQGPLEHFLRRTVKNRLVNRFKDITKSVRSPCPRCQFYNPGESPSDCAKFGDERERCNKFKNYQLSIESRKSLLNAAEEQFEREYNDDASSRMITEEMKKVILANLDANFLNDFNKLISGDKISKQKMKKLKREIRRILIESKFVDQDELG